MSIYGMFFKMNNATPVLLAMLGLKEEDVPRLRDCYIDGENIVIYTRTGGRNRDYYDNENSTLTANPYFLYDEDSDFDSTYAHFYFKFPEEYAADLKALAENSDMHKPSEKWQMLFKGMAKAWHDREVIERQERREAND